MVIRLQREELLSDDRCFNSEWLEATGTGGYSSSSISGANTRRYHGLLAPASRHAGMRYVLLSKIQEALLIGGQVFELDSNNFPGSIHPQGFQYLEFFMRDVFPTWRYSLHTKEQGEVRFTRTLGALHGREAIVLQYELQLLDPARNSIPVELILTPLIAGRSYHALTRANDKISQDASFENGRLEVNPYPELPRLQIHASGANFQAGPCWYYNFQYNCERERGFDFEEDLFCYGRLRVPLLPGRPYAILAEAIEGEIPAVCGTKDFLDLLKTERLRREALCEQCDAASEIARTLVLAADQFIVSRPDIGISGAPPEREQKTIIAGYPWFTDWGRDSMIALRGLCLSTNRLNDAAAILLRFIRARNRGLVPNRFADGSEAAEYNTADASLWLFVAVWDFFSKSASAAGKFADGVDNDLKHELLDGLLDIIAWHQRGTDYNIKVDRDGLLLAGDINTQLTWMDARVDGRPVTPRYGKAVELNALWCNALLIAAELCRQNGRNEEHEHLHDLGEKSKRRFARAFWNGARACLFDCIVGDVGDPALRPNQIIALALPFPLLSEARAVKVLKAVEDNLATPYGLRSLGGKEHGYCGAYEGSSFERDSAYHQGTVWAWLIGPFIDALRRYGGVRGRARANRYIEGFAAHLTEAGVGSISEIFDGEAPHLPRGAPFQAWSVSEVLRVMSED